MIANAFGGNIIEYDAQWFIGNLDLSNYEYIGHIGNLNGNVNLNLDIDSNYKYLCIFSDTTIALHGLNSNNDRIFSYTPYKSNTRTDPLILNIKFSSSIVKLNTTDNGRYISVYKEK